MRTEPAERPTETMPWPTSVSERASIDELDDWPVVWLEVP
jgi:hypothetical protein